MRSYVITVALAAALAVPLSLRAQDAPPPQATAPQATVPVAESSLPDPVEETLIFTPEATAECLSISRPIERAPCIGLAAEACIKDSPGGQTAPGRIGCFNGETAFWESLMAASTSREEGIAETVDSDPASPVSDDLLPRLQSAWEAYRDALCDAASQRMGEGAAQTAGLAECRLRETARHALWLEEFVGVGP